MKEEEALVRAVRVVRGSCFSSRVFVVIFTAKCAKTCESLYGLLLLVRTLRVVRGSRNSKGESAIDSNREMCEDREQKRECS